MVLESQVFDHDLVIRIRDDPSGSRKIAGTDSDVSIRETLDIGEFSIGGGIVVDGVFGREIFLVLRDGAFFHVDRKRKRIHAWMSHFSVDLGDAVILDPVEGVGAMDVQLCPERVAIFFHGE